MLNRTESQLQCKIQVDIVVPGPRECIERMYSSLNPLCSSVTCSVGPELALRGPTAFQKVDSTH